MGQVVLLFSILAVASMITGNVLALLQNNVKRLLAYSSIAHLGYVIVAFLAGGPRGTEAVGFYLIAYFVTMLGAFAVITLLSGKDRDLDRIEDYEGMGKRHPFLAAIFTAMLLSLAGIPLTAGFVGKFLVLSSGVDRSLWVLVLMMVFGSVVSIYYYLRVIVAMYLKPVPDESAEPGTSSQSLSSLLTLGALAVALLWLGVWPALCLEMIRSLTFSLF
jgi:NADH-quinone oxidoreductase subunit N